MAEEIEPVWARFWVLGFCILVVAMVLVGGATRLTDSGLSIVEWRPVTGAIPPLSEAGWAAEFAKYKNSSQYQMMNYGMSLEAFKGIFFWEWAHRLLGRLIGIYLLLPLLFLTFTKKITVEKIKRLWLIGGLVAFQGFIGWWMVKSGLSDRVSVSPYRLATHLSVALVILALGWRLFLKWNDARGADQTNSELRRWPIILTALIFFQMMLGAFVAGLDAGRSHTDWPTIDGNLLPDRYSAMAPFWKNLFENTQAVQFNHRIVGYLAAATALFIAFAKFKPTPQRKLAMAVGHMALLQAGLGIVAVLTASPLWIGMLHQAGALVLFLLANALWAKTS